MAQEQNEMTFLEHLEELRWHIIRSLASILVFGILAFIFSEFLFGEVIMGPGKSDFVTFRLFCKLGQELNIPALCIDDFKITLYNRQIAGQFMADIKYSIMLGFICAFPYAFFEIWRFIKPGLHMEEKNASRGAVFFVTALFLLGVCFGYFIISPFSFNFLYHYSITAEFENEIDLASYVGFLATLVLACGITFQLPVVVYFLTKAGIVTPNYLKTYRRHAFIIILFLSAMITPPDIFTQLLVSLPLFLLYEISIVVSKSLYKRISKDLVKHEDE
ncbi:twin-arginine translocase subunit TatC [Mangrovivirga sp. M17]|uniref:Sec-independent protein translocase protein TatC n=1 Tax=Mangrovivirga halotolerans TaxID=2993936 RepID=A0ABT3RSH4_9BACT|nr:twin-arginine translocase subunit TatC [Mangrovivirga halotolerans]